VILTCSRTKGAGRYVDHNFRDCFNMECRATRHVCEAMGLDNVQVTVPFVRTVAEAARMVELLAGYGLADRAGPSSEGRVFSPSQRGNVTSNLIAASCSGALPSLRRYCSTNSPIATASIPMMT
jgi:hypothetical protein